MGILDALFGSLFPRKKPVAPFQVTSAIPPQENYAGYTTLPNLPMGSKGDFVPDPNRLHAPFTHMRGKENLVTNAGVHFFDAGDEGIIHIPDEALQQQFNQKKALPPREVLVPDNGVVVPTAYYQRGWSQQFVPNAGMRPLESGVAPRVLLSTPISVTQTSTETYKRAPLTKARAHATKKGAR